MPSTKPPATTASKSRTFAWSVGLVGVIAGIMFATNASLFATAGDARRPQNLAELVRVERDRLEETNSDVEELRAEVSALIQGQETLSGPSITTEMAAGRVAATGPGVVVKLWDAPLREPLPEGVRPDDLVIHQQDLEAVINALWAGGAEAMSVQEHRVTSSSSIRCVGNVLLIDGSVYSPPYVVAAIGDDRALTRSLMSSPAVQTYLDYVDALQLGWSLEMETDLSIAANDGSISMDYAAVPGESPAAVPSDADLPPPFDTTLDQVAE